MRVTRNLIEELHRCSVVKDFEFINAILKIGQRMVRPFNEYSDCIIIVVDDTRDLVDCIAAANTNKE